MSTLVIGMLMSAIGASYFLYGRKQKHVIALLAGIMLCILPFAIDDPLWLGVSAVAALAAPFVVRI